MKKNNSVHLQDFPDVSFFEDETVLVKDMDMVRDICAAALFIRDQKNLRVRLPLNKLTIIGNQASKMKDFKDIIAEEVNVKEIEIINQIDDSAELKLQINFKKLGAKFGPKLKEISTAAKEDNWQKNSEGQILIAGTILEKGEFEIKLMVKDNDEDKNRVRIALPTNDCLIELDIKITKELEEEGLARDIVRMIQQNRKDANLDISDRIKIKIYNSNSDFLKIVESYKSYIADQVMARDLKTCSSQLETKDSNHYFENQTDFGVWFVGVNLDD